MRNLRFDFAARLVVFATALVCLVVGLTSWGVYRSSKADLEASLAAELLSIARSTAELVDADLVDLVGLDHEGGIAFEEEFELLRGQLDRVRNANQLSPPANPIYIMRKAHDFEHTGELEFVVMPDRGADGRYFVGNLYPAEPHNRAALSGSASSSGVYVDAEGAWISASAPLRSSEGELVGILQVDRNVDFLYTRARQRAYAISEISLVTILLGIALAMVVARRLSQPLRQISDAVEALGHGDLSQRVELRRNDEIGDLATGFDRMAEKLEQAHQQTAVATRAIATSGRLAAVGQLAAGVAHEINNPLSYVRANLAFMSRHIDEIRKYYADRAIAPPARELLGEADELIGESLEGVERALGVVQDIRSFADPGSHERREVDLADVCRTALRVARPQLAPGARLETDWGDTPHVSCSVPEVEQVVLELVVNANRAIGGEGRISLDTRREGDRVLLRVKDDGPGIDSSLAAQIFDPFFTTRADGSGLGLSTAHEILARHGATLRLVEIEGTGACFEISFPVAHG